MIIVTIIPLDWGDDMTRGEFEAMVLDAYNVRADYPFEEDFETGVFRHTDSGKWFGIAMHISERKIGHTDERMIDVVNLKCAPEVIESITEVEVGVYRAYHMNKTHWLTISLEECDDETVSWLLGISYDLTRTKIRRK